MRYEKITSFEAACQDQGKDPAGLPDYSKCAMTPEEEAFNLAIFMLMRISVSVNKDEDGNEWNPKPEERRWSPWGWIIEEVSRRSGLGLSFCDSYYDDRVTSVAPRLTFRDAARCRWAFENHKELFCRILIFQG